MEALGRISNRCAAVLASRFFFYGTMAVFTMSAVWFALSAVYPMAFDEDFHLGVIRIYAEQWSPFLQGQPVNGDAFGSLATDPSYLYHYLMSFPYRLLAAVTQSEMMQVIVLRLLNVAMVVASLFLYRKVMLRAGASQALANTALAVFVLIPIVPQLAAHINYDNAFMLLLAWLCLVVFRLTDSITAQRFDVRTALVFVALCLYVSVIKYAALPLLVGAAGFLAWRVVYAYRGAWRKFRKQLRGDFVRLGSRTRLALLIVVFVGLGLFAQRYGVNVVRYGTPVPDCGKVLAVEQCMQYGPWGRDYKLEQQKEPDHVANPAYFMWQWLRGMTHRLFFAVSGSGTRFANYIELPVPVATFIALSVASLVVVVAWWRRIFTDSPYLVFFAVMSGVYIAVLWFDQFGMYAQTSVPVAINGRYLLPILPLLAVIVGKACVFAFARYKREVYKPYVALAVLLLFLQGGGMLTYLLRADPNWYWDSGIIRSTNEAARKTIAPFVVEGDKSKVWVQ